MSETQVAPALQTISNMRGEIIQALWETFIMVGLSTTVATLFGTLVANTPGASLGQADTSF